MLASVAHATKTVSKLTIIKGVLVDLIVVFLFVLSSLLQVLNVLVSVSTLHFTYGTIKGLQGLGKVAMVKQAIRKA